MNLRTLPYGLLEQAARIRLTIAIGVLSIISACVPSAGHLLQFDRAAIRTGEFWRLATGHLTHWNAEHIQWDLLMFMVLGAVCELRHARRMQACVVAAAASVSMLVWFCFPQIEAYRGLSGVDTALFALLSIDLMCDGRRQKNRLLAIASGGLFFGFAIKTAYEAITGQAYFVDQQAAGFELVVWDHIIAATIGVVIAFGAAATSPRRPTSDLTLPQPRNSSLSLVVLPRWK